MDKLERAHSAARSAELKLKTATTLRSIGDNAPINREYIIDARDLLERALALLNDYEIDEYQNKAAEFAVYDSLDYPLLALGEEVGELQGKVAKYVRKQGVSADIALLDAEGADCDATSQLRSDIVSEAGDVLWNLSNLLDDLGITLETVARMNIGKLESRKKRDVIVGGGGGDNR